MDLKEIQNLIKFVAKSGASEVKLEMDDVKITIKTGSENETTIVQQMPVAAAPMMQQPAPVVAAPAPTAETPAPATAATRPTTTTKGTLTTTHTTHSWSCCFCSFLSSSAPSLVSSRRSRAMSPCRTPSCS